MPAAGRVDTVEWPDCKTLGVIDSLRVVNGKEMQWEQRYYISSRVLDASEQAHAVRAHWGIENQLHWMLDVCFNEDASTLRTDHAPQNLSLLNKDGAELDPTGSYGSQRQSQPAFETENRRMGR